MEQNVKRYLTNIYENYLVDTKEHVQNCYKAKCLGAMEALLIVLGVIGAGQPFEYLSVKKEYKLFWFIPIVFHSKENYEELILRHVRKTIHK